MSNWVLVAAHWPDGALGMQIEAAGAEQRDVRTQRPAQLEHVAGADQARRTRDGSGAHVVA
jgi:hypothetical protein